MKKSNAHKSDTFVVDGAYFRAQAREALKTFVAPLAGVYEAAKGSSTVGYDKQQQKASKKRV